LAQRALTSPGLRKDRRATMADAVTQPAL